MLRQLLNALRTRSVRFADPVAAEAAEPVDLQQQAPLDDHLQILFGEVRIGTASYPELLRRCAAQTGTQIRAGNLFRRAQGGINLARYFTASLAVEGQRAECGVFRGFSALLMCHAARAVQPGFDGAGMYLFDSFERFSPPQDEDMIRTRSATGEMIVEPPFPLNAKLDTSLEHVQRALSDFGGLSMRKGWIPATLHDLAEAQWAFVHLDVDLYAPTLGALEYFHPRLARGGIIITDDYGAPNYPGARKAWDAYCDAHQVAFIALGTGQAVIIGEA